MSQKCNEMQVITGDMINKTIVVWSIVFQTNLDGPFKRSGFEGLALEHVQNIDFLKWYKSSTINNYQLIFNAIIT